MDVKCELEKHSFGACQYIPTYYDVPIEQSENVSIKQEPADSSYNVDEEIDSSQPSFKEEVKEETPTDTEMCAKVKLTSTANKNISRVTQNQTGQKINLTNESIMIAKNEPYENCIGRNPQKECDISSDDQEYEYIFWIVRQTDKMNNEKLRHLIQLYGSKELLWNSKFKDYHNKWLRQDAWNDISSVLNLPIPDLKKKITTLLASYRREKSRIAKSLITSSGVGNVYASKWFAFEDFNFMKDKNVPNDTSDTMTEDTPPTQNEIANDEEPIRQPATEKQVEEPRENCNVPYNPRKKSTKRKTNTEGENAMLKKAFQILNEASLRSSDPCFIYGQHIANELRKYDQQTLAHVKHVINNTIYEADLGKYASHEYYIPNCEQTQHKTPYNPTPSPQSPQPTTQSSQPPLLSHTPVISSPSRQLFSGTPNDEPFESSTDSINAINLVRSEK